MAFSINVFGCWRGRTLIYYNGTRRGNYKSDLLLDLKLPTAYLYLIMM